MYNNFKDLLNVYCILGKFGTLKIFAKKTDDIGIELKIKNLSCFYFCWFKSEKRFLK